MRFTMKLPGAITITKILHALIHTVGDVETMLDVTDNATGATFKPTQLNRAFQVVITGTATVTLYISLDGSTWEPIKVVTATSAFSTAEPWTFMRFVASGMSSATAKAYMAT